MSENTSAKELVEKLRRKASEHKQLGYTVFMTAEDADRIADLLDSLPAQGGKTVEELTHDVERRLLAKMSEIEALATEQIKRSKATPQWYKHQLMCGALAMWANSPVKEIGAVWGFISRLYEAGVERGIYPKEGDQ